MGIQHLFSPHYATQRVGTPKRRHQHIMETALTLLHQASMPLQYWSCACQTTGYIINHMPTTILQGNSPFEVLFHVNPNYSSLRTFGCLCYPWLKPYNKMSPLCLSWLLGHQPLLQCLDPSASRVSLSRHVIF